MDGANQSTEGQRETSRSCVILQGSPETAKAMLHDYVASPLLVGCLVMPLFGAHMSIAGGYYKALVAAHEYRCETVQLFTKNFPNLHWQAATGFCRVQAVRPALPYW